MTEYTSRQLQRIERKRNKMAAYLAIATFNDQDRKSSMEEEQRKRVSPPEKDQSPDAKRQKTDGRTNEAGDGCDPRMKWIECESTLNSQGAEAVAELEKLRKLLIARKQFRVHPWFRLNAVGSEAELSGTSRVPLLTADIRNLLMYTLLGIHSPYSPRNPVLGAEILTALSAYGKPNHVSIVSEASHGVEYILTDRWCVVEKSRCVSHAVALIIEGLTLYDFVSHESCFQKVCAHFPNRVEVVVPAQYSGSLVRELAIVPLATAFREELVTKYGNLAAAEKELWYGFPEARAIFPVAEAQQQPKKDEEVECGPLPPTDVFPRTKLLLSAVQLLEENYPLPLPGEMHNMYAHYVLTKEEYREVTPHSPMLALDCEMCRTDTKQLELTRISLVNEKFEVVYDTLVKPHNKITNYLTQYSGVTAQMLDDVTVRLADVQQKLREILPPDAILVGQSLNMDLHTLRMMHPYIIDTSVIFNLSGCRTSKSKLAALAYRYLDRTIQTSKKGHSPVEDSIASMQLVFKKLANSVKYGDQILSRKMNAPGDHHMKNIADIILNKLDKNKLAVVVSREAVAEEYRSFLQQNALGRDCRTAVRCLSAGSNEEVITRTCEVALEHALTIAQLHVEATDEAALRSVDEWCGRVFQHLAVNGLCVVLLGGRPGRASGACFVGLKLQGNSSMS